MKKDKETTEVVFLITQESRSHRKEAVAYFPNVWWNQERDTHAFYVHNGEHGGCYEGWAAAQIVPHTKLDKRLVEELKTEMESNYGYNFKVLDAGEWIKSLGWENVPNGRFSWYRTHRH